MSASVIHGLSELSIDSMDFDRGGSLWAARLLVENAETLDHLTLGLTTRIAYDYALNERPRYANMSTLFAADVKKGLSELDLEPMLHLSLESLYLSGLDLGSVIRGEMAFDIDFNKIVELRLKSCPGLSQVLYLLTGQGDSPKLALGALQDLYLRLENPDPNFITNLECFLKSVRRLIHLQVLIDKVSTVHDIEPILRIHGKTLITLVWDERCGRRTHLGVSSSLLSSKTGNLGVISRKCPYLTTLGIPLDWETISNSDKYHESVTHLQPSFS